MSRSLFFKSAVLLSSIILLGSPPSRAEDDPFPTGPEAGLKLAAELRALKPDQSEDRRGVLKMFGRKQKLSPVPLSCQLKVSESNWTVTYVTAPTDTNVAEKFVIIFSTNGPNRYFYARADKPGAPPGEAKEISGAEADIPVGGSDFWLSDLGLEFLHWPDQNRLRGDIHDSRGRYVLVSTNPHPRPGGYSKVKTWFDKEAEQPTAAEAFGTNNTNRPIKSFTLEKVAPVDDRYEVKAMVMQQGNMRTRLEFDVPKEKK